MSDEVTLTFDADADSSDWTITTDATDLSTLDSASSAELLVSNGTEVAWTSDINVDSVTMTGSLVLQVGEKDVTLDFEGCSDGQLVTYRNQKVGCETLTFNVPLEAQPMNPYSISGIALMILVSLITVKWIAPRVNWRTLIRGFFHLIYRPAKTEVDQVKAEWEEVKSSDSQ